MRRHIAVLAGTVLVGSLGLAAPATAQEPVPLVIRPTLADEAPPGAILVPPAVFGGAAYGYSGYGYWYDGPGEGPLAVPRQARRSPYRSTSR